MVGVVGGGERGLWLVCDGGWMDGGRWVGVSMLVDLKLW